MLYNAYEVQRSWLAGASKIANFSSDWLSSDSNPLSYYGMSGIVAASLDVFAHAAAPRGKPEFGLDTVVIDGTTHAVREEIVDRMPFGQLKHFVRDGAPEGQPRLLIVAPMSGHFATLLRGTVERLLPGHEVYITDWRDAKLVSLDEGSFDLEDYVDTLIRWCTKIGPGAHMLAVCQPSVPAYAAIALMNAENHPATPRTLTMMGGPVDTREAPTAVNTLATERPHAWFQQNVICTVPAMHPGHGRKVYPGFLQLAGFMTMNLGSHLNSHWEMFKHLVDGDEEGADATRDFYAEYRSVCDMTAEFYLQTVDVVFQRHLLPKGKMMHRGRRVDPGAITRTALLAIEGERDDISGVGQTKAALTLATALPAADKKYHLAKGAGHYGIFNGRKWREKIAPVVERFIADHD
jgi:poly(3-hydroxybutyrate) depolymerase